jgi:hypothetical protein
LAHAKKRRTGSVLDQKAEPVRRLFNAIFDFRNQAFKAFPFTEREIEG